MEKSVVISGEASETESDEEVTNLKKTQPSTPSVQGSIITGEDSESENDNAGSVSSAASALNLQATELLPAQNQSPKVESGCYNSLLHRKLRESNTQLYNDVELFCNEIVSEAYRTVTLTDQNLLKSQISLQGALSAMKSLSSNSLLIKNKLQTLLSAKFIPKINLPVSTWKD